MGWEPTEWEAGGRAKAGGCGSGLGREGEGRAGKGEGGGRPRGSWRHNPPLRSS